MLPVYTKTNTPFANEVWSNASLLKLEKDATVHKI